MTQLPFIRWYPVVTEVRTRLNQLMSEILPETLELLSFLRRVQEANEAGIMARRFTGRQR
jgi:hypothetical protein